MHSIESAEHVADIDGAHAPVRLLARIDRNRFVLVAAAYWLGGSLLAYYLYYRGISRPGQPGSFGLDFGFGPLIEAIVRRHEYRTVQLGIPFSAYRMPVIPLLLAALSKVSYSLLWITLAKNALCCGLLSVAVYRARSLVAALPRPLLGGAALLGLTMPQMLHFGFVLEMEEGYLISMIAFLFVHFLLAARGDRSSFGSLRRQAATWTVLVLVNGALFLTKSSMLPLSCVFAILFWVASRRNLVGIAFITAALVAPLCWGMHNIARTGHFAITSSADGWNGYKGNNSLTHTLYPQQSLDLLDILNLIPAPPSIHDEWSYDAYYRSKMFEFIKEHPGEVLRLDLRKAQVFFLAVGTSPGHPRLSGFQAWMYRANAVYMVMFRAVMVAALFLAFRTVLRGAKGTRLAAAGFLAVTFCYAGPYVIGFAYQRHVMPLVLPTLIYIASQSALARKQERQLILT